MCSVCVCVYVDVCRAAARGVCVCVKRVCMCVDVFSAVATEVCV
jgi:hypothetical protein